MPSLANISPPSHSQYSERVQLCVSCKGINYRFEIANSLCLKSFSYNEIHHFSSNTSHQPICNLPSKRRVEVKFPTHNGVRHYTQDYERTTIHYAWGIFHSEQTKEYLYSPYGLVAIRNNGNLQAVATDHLGSIVAEYNPRKGGTEFFGYDAWGRRYRKDGPSNFYYFDEHLSESSNPTFFNDFYSRGYTGHEHLDAFGLIKLHINVPDFGDESMAPFLFGMDRNECLEVVSTVWI